MPDSFSARLRPVAFLACLVLASLLLGSWIWPPTSALWDRLDRGVFHVLNAPLDANALWAHLWGIANMRATDLAVALVMFAALVRDGWFFTGAQLRQALYGFLVLLIVLTVIRTGLVLPVLNGLELHRPSPSLVMDDALRLSAMFPDWAAQWGMKDSSIRSFPGDHAAVLLLWVGLLVARGRRDRRYQALALAFLFVLPRLVSGAHWATDILVGSVSLCLVTLALVAYTPLGERATRLLARLADPLFRLAVRLPLVGRWRIVAGR